MRTRCIDTNMCVQVRQATGRRVYVDDKKWGVLSCLGYSPELMQVRSLQHTFMACSASNQLGTLGAGTYASAQLCS